MATRKDIEYHLKIALAEIGAIAPWWSKEDRMYVFEHPAYPRVMHADPDLDETVKGYLRALRAFIRYRLDGQLSKTVERVTSGRGGYRSNSGRPRNTLPTVRMYIPQDIAEWIRDPQHVAQVRKMMQG